MIELEKADFPIVTLCRVLGVSASGFYAWRERSDSDRTVEDMRLTGRIVEIHKMSDGTYGAPRIHAQLRQEQERISRKRVARLMGLAGIQGVHRRRRPRTTKRAVEAVTAPDLVKRDFTADAPDRVYVADITYIPTWVGFVYLAVVLDVFSRRAVGWSMRDDLSAQLVIDALDMAVQRRRPGAGVIHHSDHGSQYTSIAFGARLYKAGMAQSLGSIGDCYDNAMAESFFASLECELLDRRSYKTRSEARISVFEWIEGWYNTRRLHSSLGYKSPAQFESDHAAQDSKSGHDEDQVA